METGKNGQGQVSGFAIIRRRCIVGAVLIFLGIFVVQLLSYILTMLAFTVISGANGQSRGDVLAFLQDKKNRRMVIEYYSLVASVIFIVWCGWLYLKSDWREKKDYRKVFSGKHLFQILTVGFCGCAVLVFLLTCLEHLFPAAFSSYSSGMENFNTGTVPMYLYALVLGPVAEELVFRGAIFDRLYLAFPFWLANLIQALLFGLYHGNPVQGIYAFLFGLLLGAVHHTGESIWNNILAHVLFNITNYILPYLWTALAGSGAVGFSCFCVLCMTGLLYGIFSLFHEIKGRQAG